MNNRAIFYGRESVSITTPAPTDGRSNNNNNRNFVTMFSRWMTRLVISRKNSSSSSFSALSIIVILVVLTLLISWFWYFTELTLGSDIKLQDTWMAKSLQTATTVNINPVCRFRRYPLHRYYKLSKILSEQPDFLSEDVYVYGLWPIVLKRDEHIVPKQDELQKICVNQTEWIGQLHTPITMFDAGEDNISATIKSTSWPFADGTNPSLLSMQRIQERASHVANMILQHYPTAYYLVTIVIKPNSQCSWKDDANETTDMYDLPDKHQRRHKTARTVLQLLDVHFLNLMETTVYLHRDASWGKTLKAVMDTNSSEYKHLPGLDDARLFLYQSQIYVSYRERLDFGNEFQVLNPIHISIETEMKPIQTVSAIIKASETSYFCCGRNMALIPDYGYAKSVTTPSKSSSPLHALTWVDPLTVIEVDTTPIHQRQQQQQQKRQRRLLQNETMNRTYIGNGENEAKLQVVHNYHRRSLKEKHQTSYIHGTNAFMVPIPSQKKHNEPQVFLGVAHFHRPHNNKPNEYAKFGHHYTHAFYTVTANPTTVFILKNLNESQSTTFHLTALSPEFVIQSTQIVDDAEIIQFISGLEFDVVTQQVILSYGINDCEGAIRRISYNIVRDMLRSVPRGKRVVDFMMPLLQQK